MDTLNSWADARRALAAFDVQHGDDLPAPLAARLRQAAWTNASPATVCGVADLVYANRDAIGDAGAKAAAQTLAGQLAAFAAQPGSNFWGWGEAPEGGTSRGLGIFLAMSRELGEAAPEGGWPAPEADPAPAADSVMPELAGG
jgi:hypothetical protein